MFSCSDVTLWQHHRSQRSRSWSRTSDLNLIQSVNQVRTIGTDDCVSLWTVTENCWRQYRSRQQVLQYWVNVRRRHRIPKSMRSGHFLTSTSSHRSTTAWRLNCFRIVYIHYINDTTYIIYKYIFSTEYSSEYYTFGSIAKRIILQSYTLNSSQALSCAPHGGSTAAGVGAAVWVLTHQWRQRWKSDSWDTRPDSVFSWWSAGGSEEKRAVFDDDENKTFCDFEVRAEKTRGRQNGQQDWY